MSAHHCARARAVDISVARFDLCFCPLDVRWTAREKPSSEGIISAVGNRDRFVKIAHLQDANDRAENFLARNAHIWFHIRINSWRNKKAFGRYIFTLISKRGLRFADLNVIEDSIVCGFVNYRTDSVPSSTRIRTPQARSGLEQALHDAIMIFFEQNQTG